ncbi:hypothetical protein Tco_1576210 [Tanacetum coccineum]
MSYPRFTKIIIDYFMSKDQSISRRNKMFWHTTRDDTMFTSMRCISRHEDTQVYGTILPKESQPSDPKPVQATKGTRLKTKAKVAKSDKKKQPAKMPKAKGLYVLSKVALTEAEQLKMATKRSKTQFHISHANGLGDGVDTQPKVPDEQHLKMTGADERTDSREDDDDDDGGSDDHDDDSDDERTESDRDEILDPNMTNVTQTEHKEEYVDERVHTPLDYELTDDEMIHDEEKIDDEGELVSLKSHRISLNISSTTPVLPILFYTKQNTNSNTNKLLCYNLFPSLLDFSSVFKFNDRVTNLEKDLSEIKQVDQYAQALSSIPTQEAQDEKNDQIGLVDTSMRTIIREEVTTQLPQILSDDGDDDDDGNDGNDDDDDDDDANDDDNQEGDDINDDDEETDSDRTESNRIKIPVLNQSTTEYYKEEEEKIDDEETMDKEDDEVTKELYDDVNVNLGNEDTNMTNADQGALEQQNKADEPLQSSSVSSDFTSKLLNLKNPSPADNEISLLMETSARNATVYAQALSSIPAIVDRYIDNKLGEAINKAIQAYNLDCKQEALDEKNAYRSTYEAAASLSEFELTKILLDKIEESKSHLRADYKKNLYDALVESYNTEKDLFNTYGEVLMLKRSRDDSDKDRDPSAGSDRETKRMKSSKEAESSKDSSKSAHAEVPSHKVDDSGVQQDQEFDMGNNDEQLTDKEFNESVTNLEKDLSEIKQVDQYAQALSFIPAIVDRYIDNKLGEAINKDIQAHNLDCRQEAQDEKNEYIGIIDTSMRTIIKEEVTTQLPHILPQVVSDFATLVIERNVTESLEAAVLARSSSQPKSTYEAAASLSKFELTKILLEKMEESKSHLRADYKKKLYDALLKPYNTDKDLFDTYGEEAESSKDSRSKEKKSLRTSKDASQSQHKSSDKSAHAEEPSHTVDDSRVQQDQEFDTGNNDEQPADKEFDTDNNDEQPAEKEVSKEDWFKKPERPSTLDSDWNKRQHVDSRPPQTWISQVAHAKEPHTSFDELMDTSFNFSVFVLNQLNIKDLTQEIPVGPAFELLKGTCKSKPYPFDLSKPLLLISNHRGHQVILQNFFFNNDLEYLKGGDLRRRYSTLVMKTKATTYEIKWIKDLDHNLWSPVKVIYDKHAYWGISHWGPKRQYFYGFAANMSSSKDVYSKKRIIAVTRLTIMKKYDYGHLEEIEVRREDQKLYKFREGDFPLLRLQYIEDMLLLLVEQKLTNLTMDERYALNVALCMFTRRIIIQRRVEDLQLGVKSYQKKLNLTKPDTFRSNLKNKTTYTAYSDLKGVIYKDPMTKQN